MSTSKSMTTYSQVLNILPERGYGNELNIKRAGASFDGSEKLFQPEQLKIIKVYRFEGESDPSDMAVIYLLHSDTDEKGFLLNAYGTYSDEDNQYYDEFIKRVPIDEMEGFELH
ncbi:phosphoribosylpyrophosphate synthetase [uncultured Algoriphagus sp.]|uniref:phosphoribosylpyrophosphate synthetase n=1 Tax=uncultured Algoriphagus sp. TaxID=417365 RepID=UPI0030EC6BFA